MLDLAAPHIMELTFSKHVDNKLDSPSSEFTKLEIPLTLQSTLGGVDTVLKLSAFMVALGAVLLAST